LNGSHGSAAPLAKLFVGLRIIVNFVACLRD
jgi:hypothetical protein